MQKSAKIAHQPVQRVDLAHHMPLAQAADGRIAGHFALSAPAREMNSSPVWGGIVLVCRVRHELPTQLSMLRTYHMMVNLGKAV
jgi:hypothetical protein